MKERIRLSSPSDLAALQQLATKAFRTSDLTHAFGEAVMRGKYWQNTACETLPQSHVLEIEEQIAAHIGIWPIVSNGLSGAHVIDWFSDPDHHGAGSRLREAVTGRFDFLYSLGSVNPAVKTQLLRSGYHRIDQAVTFARPLRPIRQILRHQHRNWKLMPRLLRNAWWAHYPRDAKRANLLKLVRVEGLSSPHRSAEYYKLLAAFPEANLFQFKVQCNSQGFGGLAILVIGYQARVVEIWLDESTPEYWAQTLRLAQSAATEHSKACEIIFRTTSPKAIEGALLSGFRKMGTEEVLYRGKRLANGNVPLDFQFGDNDQLVLAGHSGANFLT